MENEGGEGGSFEEEKEEKEKEKEEEEEEEEENEANKKIIAKNHPKRFLLKAVKLQIIRHRSHCRAKLCEAR